MTTTPAQIAVSSVIVVLVFSGLFGCAPDEHVCPQTPGTREMFVGITSLSSSGGPHVPRLVKIHESILAGQPAAIGNGVVAYAQQADLPGNILVMRQVIIEQAGGERTPEFPSIRLFFDDDILIAIIDPATDTPWRDVTAMFSALATAGITEIGLDRSNE